MSDLKKKTLNGILWSAIERFSAQGVQFVVGIMLARILLPSDYGLIGMLAIFLAISQTIIDSGFGTALIQKKNRDNLDYSTTFYFNIVIAIFFYGILFLSAPSIAKFFDEPQLINLTRVIGLTLIINALAVVQRTKFSVNIDFRTQTIASLSAITLSGIIGITMAYKGFGVWSLVAQEIVRRSVDTIILWSLSRWLPKYGFSYERFKGLFSFGYKLLISGLIDTLFKNVYTLVIGKVFSANSLGFFTRAQQFAKLPSSNLTAIINRVSFPLLSELQNDNVALKRSYKKLIQSSALLIFPLMMGLAALAKPLIISLLTVKWSESVWMLQLICFSLMWYPIHALNLNVINVKGRSDWFLKLEVIKKSITVIVLAITIPMGLKAMILGSVLRSPISLVINLHYTKRVIDYGFWKQLFDLLPIFFLSVTMGIIVFFITKFIESMSLQIIIGTLIGSLYYAGIAILFNIGDSRNLKSTLISYAKRG